MAKRRYTTAEAFALVASGEREEMRAPRVDTFAENRIIRYAWGVRCEFRDGWGVWRYSECIRNRSDYYDPNEPEEPAVEPQWRECSKAFALRNPEQSQARVWTEGHSWGNWCALSSFDVEHYGAAIQFRTYATIPSGYLCEIPEGTRAIEVRITDARGRESSSGTIEGSGKAGFVRVVEDADASAS